ncbi:MAG: hypothetical protein R3C32_10360 [Chloroflexota bacterium]
MRVTNTSVEPIRIVSAVDDVYGSLNTLGTCAGALDQLTLLPGRSYQCTFTAPVTGTSAGSPYTDTVTVEFTDNDGNTVEAQAHADVTLTDVAPRIEGHEGQEPGDPARARRDLQLSHHGPQHEHRRYRPADQPRRRALRERGGPDEPEHPEHDLQPDARGHAGAGPELLVHVRGPVHGERRRLADRHHRRDRGGR